jgi:hypothetical protein
MGLNPAKKRLKKRRNDVLEGLPTAAREQVLEILEEVGQLLISEKFRWSLKKHLPILCIRCKGEASGICSSIQVATGAAFQKAQADYTDDDIFEMMA